MGNFNNVVNIIKINAGALTSAMKSSDKINSDAGYFKLQITNYKL